MRNVSYFPPYSQKENVVTNTVLLLLSHVHRLAPDIFSQILTSITDEEYAVGPTFRNQIRVHNGEGIPDALIQQTPFEIYVETKLGDKLDEAQIKSHFVTIKENEVVKGSSILLGLTRSKIRPEVHLRLHQLGEDNGVRFFTTTFAEVADLIADATAEFRVDLNIILGDYRQFLAELDLMPGSENRLLINPCGTSYMQNKLHNIYHDQPGRSKVFCKYLGLYKDKTVSQIGEVLAVVTARIEEGQVNIVENHPLSWRTDDLHEPTEAELNRILDLVEGSPYYNLRNEVVRYFIVDRFVPMDFRKTSKHGIQGHRYFTLDGEDGRIPEVFKRDTPTLSDIANALSKITWE